MYKNEFDNHLRQNTKFNAYMFFGQALFLVEQYALNIANSCGTKDEIEKLYFDDYDFKYIKNKLLQSSLFSSNNVVLVKLEKKIPKKDVEALIEACNINPDSTIIFSCLGDAEFKTMAGYFNSKNNSASVRMFQPSDTEAIRILENEAKLLNINYDMQALNHLYFMHKNDLALCVNDLNKLSILDDKITSNIINIHCFGIGAVSFEEFLNNLILGKDISDDIASLLEEGMNEVFLLNQVTSFVQQLFMISAYARAIGTPNPKEILGFIPPKNIWDKKCKLAINIKPEVFQQMLEFLLNIELELKSSKIDNANLYIQSCLRKFTVLFR